MNTPLRLPLYETGSSGRGRKGEGKIRRKKISLNPPFAKGEAEIHAPAGFSFLSSLITIPIGVHRCKSILLHLLTTTKKLVNRSLETFRIVYATVVVTVLPQLAHACATCMGAPGTTQSESLNVALLTMLGMMTVVMGCGAFFVGRMVLFARTAQGAAVPSEDSATKLLEDLES